uniref:Type I polyketide synthase n=1 Tax=Gambierdiscus excentricus TaxID=986170 RepID=A0A1S6K816_9DINO|nr:type I polyketide synthase [Gambierdiscus excentricus]
MALTKFDVAVRDNPDPDKLAVYVVRSLQLKGFCVIDAGATPETCLEAVEEIREVQGNRLFKPPCEEVLDGLLGKKGSAAVYSFPADDLFDDCPTVGKFDRMASSIGVLLDPELPKLGLEVARRSPCMVHETGVWDKGNAPPMTEREATFWLQQFVWHKLMIVQILGPGETTMELTYFGKKEDEEQDPMQSNKTEGFRMRMKPGSMVILRPDILGHRLLGDNGNLAMSCWFLPPSCVAATRGGTAQTLTPVAQRIDQWSMKRLKQLAEFEMAGVVDKFPEQWRVVAGAAYKMDAPRELTRGGTTVEMALKGEVIYGSIEVVEGLRWLKTMASDQNGRPCFGYVLIDSEQTGVGRLLEKVEDLPADWLVAKNHIWTHTDQVVVRGCACKFPAGHNIEAQFQPYVSGPDFGTEVPLRRWDHTWVWAPPEHGDQGRATNKHGGFMDGLELFDHKRFSISVAEVISMDPQHRIGLECTEEAFNRSGFGKDVLMRSVTGVYLGGGSNEWNYVDNCMKDPAADMFGCTGGSGAIQSNRLSFNLGLMGPSITITCEGAASVMAVERGYCSFAREKVANVRCCSVGLYASMSPAVWAHMCWRNIMWNGSFHGRCKSFDDSASGYIMGDGVGTVIMNRLTERVDDQFVRDENLDEVGICCGAYLLYHGQGAGLASPSGAAEQAVVAETCRMARVDPVSVDFVECHAEGRQLWDAVEAMSLPKSLRRGYEHIPLMLSAVKTNSGFGSEGAGMCSLMRVLKGSEFATMAPMLHLSILNPYIDPNSEPAGQMLTECMAFKHRQAVSGVRGQSIVGTLGFMLFSVVANDNKVPVSKPWDTAPERIAFWPGGGGALENIALPGRGYEIIGSWDGWATSHEMQELEGHGSEEKIYMYIVTLGVNLFEQFQILIDGNTRKVIHPDRAKAPGSTPAFGPDANAQGLNWLIDGRPQLREEFVDNPAAKADAGGALDTADSGAMGNTALWQEKPKEQLRVLTSVKTEDSGVAGDRYKVQLHVAGRWRAVHWSKLSEGADAVETLEDGSTPELPAALLATAPVEDSGIYYVVAGWNMWSFSQKMSKDGGVHSLEVKLLWDGGDFQIVRDGDWTQAFHPAVPGALDGSSVVGPDDYLHGMNWCLDAKAGDVFRIELQRTFTDGEESRALSWAKLRHEGLTREERKEARTPSYYLVGSMEMGREQKLKMEWDQERMLFAANFEIGRSGEEWFAILWNGDWSWRIYPSRPDAYPGEECKHRVLGPDDEGSGLFWKISEASGDEDAAGESYEVQLHVGPNGQPTKVEWTRL